MKKLKIKIVRLGSIPKSINFDVIKKHKSSIFEIVDKIDTVALPNTDRREDLSTYSSEALFNLIDNSNADVVVGITYARINGEWYADNTEKKAIFSLRPIVKFLEAEHIPLENAVIRMLYRWVLAFEKGKLISANDVLHDETRGCMFDMNGVLEDVVFSFNAPKICVECQSKLLKRRVPINVVEKVLCELKALKKPWLYLIEGWIKGAPRLSLVITLIAPVAFGVLSAWVYDLLKPFFSKFCFKIFALISSWINF